MACNVNWYQDGQYYPAWHFWDIAGMSQYVPQINAMSGGHFFNKANRWVRDRVSYAYDSDVYGVPNYVQWPQQTLDLGHGDCEDYAFLIASICRAAGWEANVMYGGVANDAGQEIGKHAWCDAKDSKGCWYALDQGWTVIWQDQYLAGYRPEIWINPWDCGVMPSSPLVPFTTPDYVIVLQPDTTGYAVRRI